MDVSVSNFHHCKKREDCFPALWGVPKQLLWEEGNIALRFYLQIEQIKHSTLYHVLSQNSYESGLINILVHVLILVLLGSTTMKMFLQYMNSGNIATIIQHQIQSCSSLFEILRDYCGTLQIPIELFLVQSKSFECLCITKTYLKFSLSVELFKSMLLCTLKYLD